MRSEFVLLYLKVFVACANFSGDGSLGLRHSTRPFLTTKHPARQSRNRKENATFTTKVTKSTKFKNINVRNLRVLRVLLGKYVCRDDLQNEDAARVPSYPRKRVSRLIGRENKPGFPPARE